MRRAVRLLLSAQISQHQRLPDFYLTKAAARRQGWEPDKGNLCEVLPGRAIGGDRFSNREQQLPRQVGRQWYEADVNYRCEPPFFRGVAMSILRWIGLLAIVIVCWTALRPQVSTPPADPTTGHATASSSATIDALTQAERVADWLAPILNVAISLGFDSQQSFNRSFKRQYGVAPGAWRRHASHAPGAMQ
ncbi:hypothetical protein CRX72_17075 [Pantoea sp. BRM17]|nr:hypothetical protein CRX72_17075 [Pantoea sp. BRM17]